MLNFLAPPNDSRGFVHKKLLGIGKRAFETFVPGGGIITDIGGSFFPKRRRRAQKQAGAAAKFDMPTTGIFTGKSIAQLRTLASTGKAQSTRSQAQAELGIRGFSLPSVPPGVCIPPFRWSAIENRCKIFLGEDVGPNGSGGNGAAPGSPGGAPTRHVVLTPETTSGVRLRCKAGYVLGRDDLCYFGLPRNSKWRKWRPGRRPKFTGGDLNAIATAASLADEAEDLFRKTNPAKKSVARNYRANWRKPLKK